jgi:hypothetical protein
LPVADIQARHAPAVLANRLQIADRWGQPCLGYVLLYRPDQDATTALADIQQDLLAREPTMLRQPTAQLHASIAWPLAVGREFDQPKDEIWRQHGEHWLKIITAATDAGEPMRLRYRRLVVTNAAIIAIAEEPNPIGDLRRELTAALGLPWQICYGSVGIVHTSLLRYSGPLADPAGLLRHLHSTPIAVETQVSELLMIREVRYPTLDYQILQRLPLRAGRP